MSWICLMYHDVQQASPGSGGGGPERFSVSVPSFEQMLDAIRERGYEGCSLSTALSRGVQRPVPITFDDGTIGQFEHAVPSLRARGMTATFFVVTDWVGTGGFMSWSQLRQLRDWGMSVQSHTKSHPHLSQLDGARLRGELAESKRRLDEELGQSTNQIALPGGDAPRRELRHQMRDCGYEVVATSRWGTNRGPISAATDEPVYVRRCTVPKSMTTALADRILDADWRLTARRVSREASLNAVRRVLGANRYARFRRRFLDTVASDADDVDA